MRGLDATDDAHDEGRVDQERGDEGVRGRPWIGRLPRRIMAAKYWTCPKGCGARWQRSLVKCRTEGCTGRRPRKRVPVHARTLRDDSYSVYKTVNAELHAGAFGGEWTPDCCGVCGKPPSTERHMDRDHDHETGLPRGLACPGNQGCNALMPRQLTLERALLIVAYLERAKA